MFCRMCMLAGQSRSVYTSHLLADDNCQSVSQKDKDSLRQRFSQQPTNCLIQEVDEDDELLEEFGYLSVEDEQQVECNYIQPVPSQTLTMQDAKGNNIHIEIDSGATVSYAKLEAVRKFGFKINKNSQFSTLADGKTIIPSIGEIDITLYRNSFSVRFHAIVTDNLNFDFLGGNNFIKENGIIQDLGKKTITLHKKYNVPETNKSLILPTKVDNYLAKNNSIQTLIPGQSIEYQVPFPDQSKVAVSPWFQNKLTHWPYPQLCTVSKGKITIDNNSEDAINIKKYAPTIQVRAVQEEEMDHTNYTKPHTNKIINKPKLDDISINTTNISEEAINIVQQTNNANSQVFNEDLSTGYNHKAGKHIARLNWANETKPQSTKVHTISYDHNTQVLLQQVIDDLTQQNVLGIPQEDNVIIQHASPSFLVRKQKAKNKKPNELMKNDVRLVVNFGKINEYLKNIPSPITKPKDIFAKLGKWNYIISTDLTAGFYQNHMSRQDAEWLGISSPFGGLRYMKRSGQGLIGQSEELDELLAKILKSELQQGIVIRLADDLYIGGDTDTQAAINYDIVLSKLNQCNIKLSPHKTSIFLEEMNILGWTWKQGGYLSPNPHRVNALKNTTTENIAKVKDLRSFLGLYKTLLPACPNLTITLDALDQACADRQSNEDIIWSRDLIQAFKLAKDEIDNLQTLYLPKSSDQLMIEVDAAKIKPGIGHVLYAFKENKKLPVSFHSVKLSPHHAKWNSCELEALAFATAIQAEYETIKESDKPIIIAPDSKPVADAINLIKKGHFSTNPRLQTLLTNVNRIPMSIQLAGGKAKLNNPSDFQSRNSSKCDVQSCAICSFIDHKSSEPLINMNTQAQNPDQLFTNKAAWKKIQEQDRACNQAANLIRTGKTPSKKSGKIHSEIRRLCSIAKLDNDNLLVVRTQPNTFSRTIQESTVIPSVYLPALLWQIHNALKHPTKSQLKAYFNKYFYSVGLTAQIETIYEQCHFCATQKKVPLATHHQTISQVSTPGKLFHADVIKRASQNILIVTDHFSTFTSAMIIKSEKHQDLKNGLINLVTPIRSTGQINIIVDNATGFIPLINNKDPDLHKLGINLEQTDVMNKNANAVVDKACQELEREILKAAPDGRPISSTTLIQATNSINNKLRRNGQISSWEIHFNRDMFSGENLNLDYNKIRTEQVKTRTVQNMSHNNDIKLRQSPSAGDIVTIPSKTTKHLANDNYLVTSTNNEKINIQKIINPHSEKPNLRAKVYTTDSQRCQVVYKANKQTIVDRETKLYTPTQPKSKQTWNPIRTNMLLKPANTQSNQNATDENIHDSPEQQNKPDENRQESPYKSLIQWEIEQRNHAKKSLTPDKNEEISTNAISIIETSIPKRTPSTRAQKTTAKNQIAKYYNTIPQSDGMENITDVSERQKRTKSSTTYNFCDEQDDSDTTSENEKDKSQFEWDDEYDVGSAHHLEDEYVSFEDEPNEDIFRSPVTTITPQDQIIPGRVYRLDNDDVSIQNPQEPARTPRLLQHIRNVRPLEAAAVYNFDELLQILPQ